MPEPSNEGPAKSGKNRASQQLQQLAGPVDQMPRPGGDQLRTVAETPRHTRRAHPGRRRGLDVHPRIADIQHLLTRRARPCENLLDDCRRRFQRHAGTLAQHRGERHPGEEQPDELLGPGLELVRRHGQRDAPPRQFGDQLRNSVVGPRMGVDVFGVVFHEVGAHRGDGFGRAQRLGQGAFHEPQDAVADEMTVFLIGVLRQSPHTQHGVARHGQIADRVEQRAVEVEDDERSFHFFRFMFQPTAATSSDISGETMLKMQ